MKSFVVCFALYLAIMAIVVAVMMQVRANTLASMDNDQSLAAWDAWKMEAARQTGETTPVRRRVPTAAEPPTLVLMRDHFAAALFALLAPLSALYAFTAWIVTGVIRQSRSAGKREHPDPKGDS